MDLVNDRLFTVTKSSITKVQIKMIFPWSSLALSEHIGPAFKGLKYKYILLIKIQCQKLRKLKVWKICDLQQLFSIVPQVI